MRTALSRLLACPVVMAVGMISVGDLLAADVSGKSGKSVQLNLQESFKFYHALDMIKKLIEPYRSPSEKLSVIHLDRFHGASVLFLHEYKDGGQIRYEVMKLAIYNFHPEQSAMSSQAEIVKKTASLSLEDGARLLKLCDGAIAKSERITPSGLAGTGSFFHLEMKGDSPDSFRLPRSFMAMNENDPLWNVQQAVQALGNHVTFGEASDSLSEFRKISSE